MTPRRFRRLRTVLDQRQTTLTVLLDQVHKPYNFSAILRTCDAVGMYEAHAITPPGQLRPSRRAASGAQKWIKVRVHASGPEALQHLKARGFRCVVAHPCREAIDFRTVDYLQPIVVVLGGERDGVSPQVMQRTDVSVAIPMLGAVTSLNVSLAAALILFEAQRQRLQAGYYRRGWLDSPTYDATLFEWAYPRLARYCRHHNLPYPRLSADGERLDPLPH